MQVRILHKWGNTHEFKNYQESNWQISGLIASRDPHQGWKREEGLYEGIGSPSKIQSRYYVFDYCFFDLISILKCLSALLFANKDEIISSKVKKGGHGRALLPWRESAIYIVRMQSLLRLGGIIHVQQRVALFLSRMNIHTHRSTVITLDSEGLKGWRKEATTPPSSSAHRPQGPFVRGRNSEGDQEDSASSVAILSAMNNEAVEQLRHVDSWWRKDLICIGILTFLLNLFVSWLPEVGQRHYLNVRVVANYCRLFCQNQHISFFSVVLNTGNQFPQETFRRTVSYIRIVLGTSSTCGASQRRPMAALCPHYSFASLTNMISLRGIFLREFLFFLLCYILLSSPNMLQIHPLFGSDDHYDD